MIALSCDKGSIRFVREPDINLRVNCTGQPVDIGVTPAGPSRAPGRVEAATTTHWTISIAIEET